MPKRDPGKAVASSEEQMAMGAAGMDIVHPFFTHMGVPDPVGHIAFRQSGVAMTDEGGTSGDFGIHLEAGLAKHLGLHIRNDRVANNAHTEITLQYAIIQSTDGMTGLSPFVELEVPTHKGELHTFGLVGFSSMWSTQVFQVNQSVEYSPKESAIEGSVSFVGNVGLNFFPVVEFLFATAVGAPPQNSMIAGLKYRVSKFADIGIGYQVPVTEARDYTNLVLFQTDIEW